MLILLSTLPAAKLLLLLFFVALKGFITGAFKRLGDFCMKHLLKD
jgi:hypothetical protein